MYLHQTRIYLHHTDQAGRLFFGALFYLVYEAKEHFMESLGLPVEYMLAHPTLTFPLVHAEADYKSMLQSADKVNIEVAIERIGETSVVFVYKVMHGDILAATAKTVSVVVDQKTQTKLPIPLDWRKKFETSTLPGRGAV